MKLLINQPGRVGDILICLPIAKFYSSMYQIDWLCPKEYHTLFDYVDYCTPVSEVNHPYDKVIDLSFGIRTGTDLHTWWLSTRNQWQSFIVPKYHIAGISLRERWKLRWNRNFAKENTLLEYIISKYGKNYSVVHEKTHDNQINIDVKDKVLFEPIEDYSIFDWYQVLVQAQSIHCIDSSLCNFVEIINEPNFLLKKKVYYITKKVPNLWDRTILTNNWVIINE